MLRVYMELNGYGPLTGRKHACREWWWRSPSEWVMVPTGSILGLLLFLENCLMLLRNVPPTFMPTTHLSF